MRFHFIGTDYAPPPLGRERVMPIAQTEEVADHVVEHCYRIPYFDALSYLCHADALMIIGSDDPRYSASKIFPYLFAQRPLLTIAHYKSLMLKLCKEVGHVTTYGFSERENPENTQKTIQKVYDEWFAAEGFLSPFLNLSQGSKLDLYSSPKMTYDLCQVFEESLKFPQQPL